MKIHLKPRARLLLLSGGIFVIVAAGAVAYIHRRHSRERAEWKAQGIAAAHTGQAVQAVELLTRYLHIKSEDAEALRCYAQVRMDAGPPGDPQAVADTITVLQFLSQLGQIHDDERRRLMELYTRSGNDGRVVHEADILLHNAPADPSILRAKTQALMREHEWREANSTALQWSQAAPLDMAAQCAVLGSMQQTQATPKEIIGRSIALRRAHPSDARFELLESVALTLTDQSTEPADLAHGDSASGSRTAADWAREAASQAPLDSTSAGILVEQLDRFDLFDESLTVLQKQLASGGDPVIRRALARRLWESQDWAQLAQLLAKPTDANDGADVEQLYQDADALAHLGRTAEVAPIRANLAARHTDPLAVAWLVMLDHLTGAPELDQRRSLDCYENGLARDQQNPYLQYYLAIAFDRLGEIDLAISHLKAASLFSSTWGTPPAHLAELLLGRGRIGDAYQIAAQAMRRSTRQGQMRDVPVAITMARTWLAALNSGYVTDEAGLLKLLNSVQQAVPGEEQTVAVQAALLVRDRDMDGASKLLSQALRSDKPLSEVALLRYAAISQSAGLGLETQCFDRCERDHGKTPDLAYARAVRLLAAGHADQGLTLLNSGADSRPPSTQPALDLPWRLSRARYLELAGNADARQAWVELGDAYPESLAVQQGVLSSVAARRDRGFIGRTIDRLHKLTGEECLEWRLAHARWVLDNPAVTRQDAQDVSHALGDVLRVCPDCPEARLLLASCFEHLHDTDAAIQQLQAAAQLLPDSVAVAMRLAQLLEDRSDYTQAATALKRFTEGPLSNPAALAAMGWLQEHDGFTELAEKSYRDALRLQPDFMAAQNNLAMLLATKGNYSQATEALALANQAVKKNPDVAAVFDTLATVQARTRDYDGAVSSIGRAIALSPQDPNYRIRQIELLMQAGHGDLASKDLVEFEATASNSPTAEQQDSSLAERVHVLHQKLNHATTNPR